MTTESGREALLLEEWRSRFDRDGEAPAIPAATVAVLRDGPRGLESLMLRKNSRIAFGGMWVFPGGRIDDGDHDGTGDLIAAARNAAAREAREEADIALDAANLVHFSYWIPPAIAPNRFATWFFASRAPDAEVTIDDGEIVAPTWVTLHTLGRFGTVHDALAGLSQRRPRRYEPRIGQGPHGPVSMWHGDAGYETADPAVPGPRHRLEMTPDGYLFDESGYDDAG